MAPRTVGGLAHGMCHGGHILHKKYEFIGAEGLAPVSTFSRILNLYPGELVPMVRGGHTLRTALSGNILGFTYKGGRAPSLIIVHGQIFYLGSQRPMAHGKLT